MKSEILKTGAFLVVAIALAAAANWIQPEAATPEVLSDEGEPFFPDFRDVLAVKAIEVIAYDEDQAVATPLKVEFRDNKWLLPSHNDYPAEAEDRLDKAAGALLGLHKDLVISDRVEDHATYGVIDPLDTEVASLTGRGKRVTLRNEAGDLLADLIIGKPISGREGFRYIRLPGQKRVYGVKTDADPSADFRDWVEDNLLRLSSSRVRRIRVNSYSVDESFGRLTNVQRVTATRNDGEWSIEGDRKASKSAAAEAARTLASIRILGARPKPEPLAEQLRDGKLEMTLEAVMSLRQRGFFLTPTGQLLANEGEVAVETDNGVVYTLRFGEIVSGSTSGGSARTPPAEVGDEPQASETAEQDRYVLVTVRHLPELAEKFGGSGNGEATARYLGRKFADWYYIISGEDFRKIRMQ